MILVESESEWLTVRHFHGLPVTIGVVESYTAPKDLKRHTLIALPPVLISARQKLLPPISYTVREPILHDTKREFSKAQRVRFLSGQLNQGVVGPVSIMIVIALLYPVQHQGFPFLAERAWMRCGRG